MAGKSLATSDRDAVGTLSILCIESFLMIMTTTIICSSSICLVLQVMNECSKAEQWLQEGMQLQNSLPKNVDPVLWSNEIRRMIEELDMYYFDHLVFHCTCTLHFQLISCFISIFCLHACPISSLLPLKTKGLLQFESVEKLQHTSDASCRNNFVLFPVTSQKLYVVWVHRTIICCTCLCGANLWPH